MPPRQALVSELTDGGEQWTSAFVSTDPPGKLAKGICMTPMPTKAKIQFAKGCWQKQMTKDDVIRTKTQFKCSTWTCMVSRKWKKARVSNSYADR